MQNNLKARHPVGSSKDPPKCIVQKHNAQMSESVCTNETFLLIPVFHELVETSSSAGQRPSEDINEYIHDCSPAGWQGRTRTASKFSSIIFFLCPTYKLGMTSVIWKTRLSWVEQSTTIHCVGRGTKSHLRLRVCICFFRRHVQAQQGPRTGEFRQVQRKFQEWRQVTRKWMKTLKQMAMFGGEEHSNTPRLCENIYLTRHQKNTSNFYD